MAHAQKPDLVFRRNGRVHLNLQGASVQSTTGSRGVRISGSNAGYTMFRDSVEGTGYLLRSPVSPSLPHPCVTVCHHISAARPGRTLPPGKTRYPLYRRLGGPQGRSGQAENLVRTGIRSPDRPARSQSLYRLSYPAHMQLNVLYAKYVPSNADYDNFLLSSFILCIIFNGTLQLAQLG